MVCYVIHVGYMSVTRRLHRVCAAWGRMLCFLGWRLLWLLRVVCVDLVYRYSMTPAEGLGQKHTGSERPPAVRLDECVCVCGEDAVARGIHMIA